MKRRITLVVEVGGRDQLDDVFHAIALALEDRASIGDAAGNRVACITEIRHPSGGWLPLHEPRTEGIPS